MRRAGAEAAKRRYVVAHVTDVHFQTVPSLRELLGKRLVGTANLYLRGRRRQFSIESQRRLGARLEALEGVDAVVCSGDLTAQALRAEFELAREVLGPAFGRLPTLVVAGNHDVYVRGEGRRTLERSFGRWMGERLDVGEGLAVLGLDPCRPTALLATGRYPRAQLERLEAELASPSLDGRAVVLATHYPVVGPGGEPYADPQHCVLNNGELLDVLRAARRRPDVVVHGHIHRSYSSALPGDCGGVPTRNPGAGGLASGPAYGLYTLEPGAGLVDSERVLF